MNEDEEDGMLLLLEALAIKQAVASIVSSAYPTDGVGINVMAELGHRAGDQSISEDDQ